MSRKIKKKTIGSELHVNSSSALEKWAKAAAETPDPDPADQKKVIEQHDKEAEIEHAEWLEKKWDRIENSI